VGEIVADRYRLEQILAEGGMGVVYLGRHIELGQEVAVKLLRRELCDERRVVARFLEEAKAAAALRSEHVVRVMDVGVLASGVPYLVMEYLEGTNLGDLVEHCGPLSIERALDYLLQACDALAAAHDAGIVHRDIKPDNLFLTTDGSAKAVVKLVDFGIAKRLDSGGERIVTGPQEFMGSPGFMSPEQISEPSLVDARTDIFSLGSALHYLLTGKLPFDGDSLAEICDKVLYASVAPLRSLRPSISPELEGVVRRCLEKDRSNRYTSIRELAVDLFACRDRLGASVDAELSPAAASALRGESAFTTRDLPMSGFRVRTLAAIAATVSLAVAAIYVADQRHLVELRALTDGYVSAAPLAENGATIAGAERFDERPWIVGPRGVIAAVARPRHMVAERERLGPERAANTVWAAEVARRRRAYREYLRRNGLRPLREVLREETATQGHLSGRP
jgi:tRNA A-37 threonylcarbamoyl transferase component Bud32